MPGEPQQNGAAGAGTGGAGAPQAQGAGGTGGQGGAAPPPATGTAPATGAGGSQGQGGGTVLTTPPAPAPAGDASKGEAPKGKEATGTAPAEITLKLPEGFQAGKEVDALKGLAKEMGWTSEQTQRVFDLHLQAQESQLQQLADHHEQQQQQWVEALKTDKEFGGAGYDANRIVAQKAFAQFGSPELTKYLNETGLGNHPELVRAFWRAGKALGEDTPSATGAGAVQPGGDGDPNAHLKSIYTNSPELFGGQRREKPSLPTTK